MISMVGVANKIIKDLILKKSLIGKTTPNSKKIFRSAPLPLPQILLAHSAIKMPRMRTNHYSYYA